MTSQQKSPFFCALDRRRFIQLLGGAVLIEKVFAWPGMGLLAVEALGARDYLIVLATSMIAAVLVVLAMFWPTLVMHW